MTASTYDAYRALLSAARAANDRMPPFTVDQTRRVLVDRGVALSGSRVAVFGLTYKADVAETRNTPARPVVRTGRRRRDGPRRRRAGRLEGADAELVTLDAVAERAPDAVVLVTPHESFRTSDRDRLPADCLVVDCRDALAADATGRDVYTTGSGLP